LSGSAGRGTTKGASAPTAPACHGGGRGFDHIAGRIAAETFHWDVEVVPAEWEVCGDDCPKRPHRKVAAKGGTFCPYAGPRRNQRMVDLWAGRALGVLAMPALGHESRGTHDAVRRATKAGLRVWAVPLKLSKAQGVLL